MIVYLVKAASAFLEWLGRIFAFNWFPPEVGRIIRDIPYGSSKWRKQSLDVIVPKEKPPCSIIVYIHGGGFHFMDKRSYVRICRSFANKGYPVFNVNYRLAPKYNYSCQFEDIGKAIMWSYNNAAIYGGDNSRVFLAGDSAGAYFASMYAAACKKPELLKTLSIKKGLPPYNLKGLPSFYGGYVAESILATVFPMIKMACYGFLANDPVTYREKAKVASPIRHITSAYPPSFLASGAIDSLHSESVSFERALTAAGVPHHALFFTKKTRIDAFHGFLSAFFLPSARRAMKKAIDFLFRVNTLSPPRNVDNL